MKLVSNYPIRQTLSVFDNVDVNHAFPKDEYSKFKYGSGLYAREFAYELFQNFINSSFFAEIELDLMKLKPIVIIPSPYLSIPTASCELAKYFRCFLENHLAAYNYPLSQESKIHRMYSYNSDYGNMDAEQRRNAISSDIFHMDAAFLKNKILLFIDDIRISGAHEERVQNCILKYNLDNEGCDILFLYYAVASKEVNPKIEGVFNKYSINSLEDVYNLYLEDPYFYFNTRNVKFILSYDNYEFMQFTKYAKKEFKQKLILSAIANGYHKVSDFSLNFNFLNHKL